MTSTEEAPTRIIDPEVRSTIPTVDEYLRADNYPVPDFLWERTERGISTEPVSVQDYLSPEHHALEAKRLWGRVWQWACWTHDIPKAGDFSVYEIENQSIIVIRQKDDSIRAMHNSCRHRGAKLLEGLGNSPAIRCTFHAWTWNNDGSLKNVPCHWDFPQVQPETHGLPEVRTAVWNGMVFINLDPDAEPFEDFLGPVLPRHFADEAYADRFKAAHVTQLVNCNWKVAMEAFLEIYHVAGTHPQTTPYAAGIITQYDAWGLHGRQLGMLGVPDPRAGLNLTEEEVVEALVDDGILQVVDGRGESDRRDALAEGGATARTLLANWNRTRTAAISGRDYTQYCDSEMIDVIQYHVFPNILVWANRAVPIVHRFRPAGAADHCWFESFVMVDCPAAMRPPNAPETRIGPDDSYAEKGLMGGAGVAFDQDVANMARVQAGMKSASLPHVEFSLDMEANCRGLHTNIDQFMQS